MLLNNFKNGDFGINSTFVSGKLFVLFQSTAIIRYIEHNSVFACTWRMVFPLFPFNAYNIETRKCRLLMQH